MVFDDEEGLEKVCAMNYAYMSPYKYLYYLIKNATCDIVQLPQKYFHFTNTMVLNRELKLNQIFNNL